MASAHAALALLKGQRSPPEHAEILIEIALFHHLDAKPELAAQVCADAVDAAVSGKHRLLEGRARMALGTLLGEIYDFTHAMSELVMALEIARSEGDEIREGRVLNNLAALYSDAGEYSEALEIFESLGTRWLRIHEGQAASTAFQNAALAALRIGAIQRGLTLSERAARFWTSVDKTPYNVLAANQGGLTRCQLLIQANRIEEAAACASGMGADASSGSGQAETFRIIADAITRYANGNAASDIIDRAIGRARKESPNQFDTALAAAIRVYEHAGQFDKALSLQYTLLEFNKGRKFEEVRRALGGPSSEEGLRNSKLAQLGQEVDRKIDGLINTSIRQSPRSAYDYARIFRVSRCAELFAQSRGLPSETVEKVTLAAKLIDVGNLVVSDHLLRKPSSLSAGERRIVAEHAKFGAKLLEASRLDVLSACAPIVRFHHDRWDGCGTNALKGTEIPLEARIVALSDAFDALSHARPWRRALSTEDSLHTIQSEAGTRFDPDLAKTFVEWLRVEVTQTVDFERLLAAEAFENEFIRMRMRVDHMILHDRGAV